MESNVLIHPNEMVHKFYSLRGKKVMFDFDLADLYGLETRILKQQVKRNSERVPGDFMFQLTKNEWNELITNCDKFPANFRLFSKQSGK